MNIKLLLTAVALCAGAFAHAGVIGGIDVSNFVAPTVVHFDGDASTQNTYDFGNGMSYAGQGNTVNYSGFYSLGNAGGVTGGLDDDGYFATGDGQSTFEFKFAGGVTRFGFHGAEAVVDDGSLGRDGLMSLAFYGMDNALINTVQVDTGSLFSWDDFYGFESNGGAIGRVVFQGVGSTILDDVTFDKVAATVPEPGSMALLGLGLAGFAAARRTSRASK